VILFECVGGGGGVVTSNESPKKINGVPISRHPSLKEVYFG